MKFPLVEFRSLLISFSEFFMIVTGAARLCKKQGNGKRKFSFIRQNYASYARYRNDDTYQLLMRVEYRR